MVMYLLLDTAKKEDAFYKRFPILTLMCCADSSVADH